MNTNPNYPNDPNSRGSDNGSDGTRPASFRNTPANGRKRLTPEDFTPFPAPSVVPEGAGKTQARSFPNPPAPSDDQDAPSVFACGAVNHYLPLLSESDIEAAGDYFGGKLIMRNNFICHAISNAADTDARSSYYSNLHRNFFTMFLNFEAPAVNVGSYTCFWFSFTDDERTLYSLPAAEKQAYAGFVFGRLLSVITNHGLLQKIRSYSPVGSGALGCLTMQTVFVDPDSGSLRLLPLLPSGEAGLPPELPREAGTPAAGFSTDLYSLVCIYIMLSEGVDSVHRITRLPGSSDSDINKFILKCVSPFPAVRPQITSVASELPRELMRDADPAPAPAKAPPAPPHRKGKHASRAAEIPTDFTDLRQYDDAGNGEGGFLRKLFRGIGGAEPAEETDSTYTNGFYQEGD